MEMGRSMLIKKHSNDKKILISTDTIAGGGSLRPIVKFLEERKIDYDITATSMDFVHLSTDGYNYSTKELIPEKIEERLGLGNFNRIHIGSFVSAHDYENEIKTNKKIFRKDTLDIQNERLKSKKGRGEPDSAGVKKIWKDLNEFTKVKIESAYKIDNSDTEEMKKFKETGRGKVNQTRKEIKILSEQLTDWYRKNLE